MAKPSPYRSLPADRRVALVTHLIKSSREARELYIQRVSSRPGGFRAVTLRTWPPDRLAKEVVRTIARIALRLGGYLLAAWGTVALLAAGTVPAAAAVTLLVAVYTTLPLLVFARWRGWPFYPGAAFRLLVVRPFWYTNLMLPFVAG